MNIHDIIFAICAVVFWIALLPSVFSENKPHPKTSLITSAGLYFMAGNFLSMKLWFSGISQMVCAITWSILFVQVFVENRKSKKEKELTSYEHYQLDSYI